MNRSKKLAIGAALIAGLYLGGCFILAYGYVHPIRTVADMPGTLTSIKVGAIPAWVTSDLAAGRPSAEVFVFAHGYGGNRGQWADVMVSLRARGYDSIAPAMPGQDESRDKTVGFGEKESETIADCVHWAKLRGAKKVVACGVSLGGSATWLATRKTRDIDAVVTEGAFADFEPTMEHWLDRALPFGHVILRPVEWFGAKMAGIDPKSVVPIQAAQRWSGPALIIQGADDTLIDRSNATQLAAACGGDLWVVPGASHAQCAEVAPGEYQERLVRLAKRAEQSLAKH